MNLTTELLTPFIGGQIEIQNEGQGYLYRGQIKSGRVTSGELVIELDWMGKCEGFPSSPSKWVKDDTEDWAISLQISGVSNIGPSRPEIGGGDRICINCPSIGELIVLYPADGSKLDPARIEGLQLAA